MLEDDGQDIFGMELAAVGCPGSPFTHTEQHLSQNRNVQCHSVRTGTRTCDVSQFHLVHCSAAPLLQVHSAVTRASHIREVRNRTVTECCEGYVQLYSDCVPECPDCSTMVCDGSRNCTCVPGYTGDQCNETCESGNWGEKCKEVCVCTAEEECNFATGECSPRPPTTSPTQLTTTDSVTTTTFDIKPSPSSVWTDITSAPDYDMETTQYFPYSADTIYWSHTTARSIITPTPHTTITEKLSTATTLVDKLSDTEQTNFSDDLQNNSNNNLIISDQDIDSVTFYNRITDSTKLLTPTTSPIITTADLANRSKHTISTKLLNKIVNTTQSAVMVDIHSLKNITGLDIKFGDDKNLNIDENEFKRVSVNSSIIYAQWINEISTNTSITIAAALVILTVLLVIVVSATLFRCHHSEKKLPSNSKATKKNDENSAINLVVRNSHYAIPSPPTFSFSNGYALDLTQELREANYDHPCSVRCLVDVNEHLYDELRY